MRGTLLMIMTALVLLSASQCDAQIFHKKKPQNQSTDASNNAEPDKILYDRAMDDVKHGKYETGRLALQTLINTYPDSEYLAKAKLTIADSYYKEGGTSNLAQAIEGYKSFIVFFPFLPEATYAQLQVAMAHYKQMDKPDRDRTQAKEAEDEFQTFLQKYPNDPLAPKAEQYLREVQEVLAEGDYRVAHYYYVKGDMRAASGRLIALTRRYPLYSKADDSLWMLGNIFEKSERKDIAAQYYAQIVRNYPLSPDVPDARSRLKALGVPIPQPDPQAQAWMQAEQNAPRQHNSLLQKPMGMMRSTPDVHTAAQHGKPTLEPESESTAAGDILSGGSHPTIGGGGSGAGTIGVVATITPGKSDGNSGAASGAETAPPAEENNTTNPPAAGPNAATSAPAAGAESGDAAKADAAPASAAPATAAGTTDGAAKSDATKTDGTQDSSQKGTNPNSTKESTSKKKKGIKKLIPW